jgi:hypothetical protein
MREPIETSHNRLVLEPELILSTITSYRCSIYVYDDNIRNSMWE